MNENKTEWDIIIGGFYVNPALESKLVERMKGIGIWGSDHRDGQALYRLTKTNNRINK